MAIMGKSVGLSWSSGGYMRVVMVERDSRWSRRVGGRVDHRVGDRDGWGRSFLCFGGGEAVCSAAERERKRRWAGGVWTRLAFEGRQVEVAVSSNGQAEKRPESNGHMALAPVAKQRVHKLPASPSPRSLSISIARPLSLGSPLPFVCLLCREAPVSLLLCLDNAL